MFQQQLLQQQQEDVMSSSATSSPASTLYSPCPPGAGASWVQELSSDQCSVRLIGLLYQCAAEVAAGALDRANLCLEHIMQLASLDAPHALQRLAAVFADALARKLLNLVPGLSRALLTSSSSSSSPSPVGTSSGDAARRHMFDMLPFLKLAYLTTNHAILEAMEGERFVHVVDLSGPAANPAQWIALFHAFRSRSRDGQGVFPHLRVTAVHESKEFLGAMAASLAREAEAFDIPFQFAGVESRLEDLDSAALRHCLRVRSGEALAVSVALQLHRLLAADDDGRCRRHPGGGLTPLQSILAARSSPRSPSSGGSSSFGELLERELNTRLQLSPDASSYNSPQYSSPTMSAFSSSGSGKPKLESFLSAIKALSPKVMVITEQEANHNGAAFHERFDEALNYYASLFDCLERASSGQGQHRSNSAAERARVVERAVLGEEIRSIVASEGRERKERHERAAQWAGRMEASGMERVGLSYGGAMEARKLLQSCGLGGGGYQVRHDVQEQRFFFCWHDRPLYAVSAWRPAGAGPASAYHHRGPR